jgi:hypothetical protein
MKFVSLALAAALAVAATPAMLSAKDVTVGETIYGPQGAVVGTVAQVGNGTIVVDTGKHKATLPAEAVGETEGKATITVSKVDLDAQIDTMMAEQAAKVQAALTVGAAVADVDGAALGTVKSVDDAGVVVESEHGPFTLQAENFSLQGDKLTAAVRAADVAAQLGASAG